MCVPSSPTGGHRHDLLGTPVAAASAGPHVLHGALLSLENVRPV